MIENGRSKGGNMEIKEIEQGLETRAEGKKGAGCENVSLSHNKEQHGLYRRQGKPVVYLRNCSYGILNYVTNFVPT